MRKKTLNRICPVCASDKAEILHTQKFALCDHAILPAEYDVVCCEQCGFVYADTSASQTDYNCFYTEKSKYECESTATGGGDSYFDKKRLSEVAEIFADKIPDRKKQIVDMGCGNGGLLESLRERGYNNVCAIDPSKACIERIKQRDIEAYHGDIFMDIPDKLLHRFDVLILSHVLEHLRDLREAVLNLKNLLKEDALIYVETPNAAAYTDFSVVPYYYFDTEHINHFSLSSFKKLFGQFGFDFICGQAKTMQLSEEQNYPAVYAFFKQGLKDTTRNTVEKFIAESKLQSSYPQIDSLALSQDELLVWGAGNYAMRLIEESLLGSCNILAFIDSDSKKAGEGLLGKQIIVPENIGAYTKGNSKIPILILSAIFSKDIERNIRALGLDNPIILPK